MEVEEEVTVRVPRHQALLSDLKVPKFGFSKLMPQLQATPVKLPLRNRLRSRCSLRWRTMEFQILKIWLVHLSRLHKLHWCLTSSNLFWAIQNSQKRSHQPNQIRRLLDSSRKQRRDGSPRLLKRRRILPPIQVGWSWMFSNPIERKEQSGLKRQIEGCSVSQEQLFDLAHVAAVQRSIPSFEAGHLRRHSFKVALIPVPECGFYEGDHMKQL